MTKDKLLKTIVALFILCILCIAFINLSSGHSHSTQYKDALDSSGYSTTIYFSAHQDDETLEDFGGIMQDLRNGKEVHVVLCTDGSSSGIYKELQSEGYDLTIDDFVAIRDAEFVNALVSIGVPPENIHIPSNRLKDGTLISEKKLLKEFIEYWVSSFSGAAVRTHSPKIGSIENHPDHFTIGEVCCELQDEGKIGELRLFVDRWHIDEYKAADGLELFELPAYGKLINDEAERLDGAIQAYMEINIEEGKYGIGGRSVPAYWEQLQTEPISCFYDREGQ